MNGFLIGYKKRMAQERAYTAELEQFKKDHNEVVRLLLKDHGLELMAIEKEKEAIAGVSRREARNLTLKLDEANQKIDTFQQNHERMEKLLTKLNKRAATYRTMMEAVAAWEEEIAIEREDDKLEAFIKWKNDREN